jgi:hypothetical protein
MFIELDPKITLCLALLTLGLSLKSLVHRYSKCSNLVDLSRAMLKGPLLLVFGPPLHLSKPN